MKDLNISGYFKPCIRWNVAGFKI